MASTIVEVSGDVAKLLRDYDRLVQKEADQIAKLKAMGDAGASAGTDIEDALARVSRANDRDMNKLLGNLGRIGPEGKAAADALKSSFQDQGKFGFKGIDQVIESIRRIDPEAAKAAQSAAELMQEADRDSEFRKTLASLGMLGDEAAVVANIIEGELEQAAEQSSQSMEQVLAKLQELKPEADLSAETIREKLKAANDASQKEFDETVNRLRKLGPAGEQVADRLAHEMEAAAERSENSIDGIIDKLKELNPAAATAARSIHREIEASNKKSEGSFRSMAKSASTELASIVTAYFEIQAAIQTVIELNRKVAETNREAFSNLKATESGDRRLLQVAGPGEFSALRDRADSLSTTYGIGREAARGLVFQGKSENFLSALDFIGRNAQVIDPESQASVAGQIPGLFKNETLTPQQAINSTLAAATESRLGFEEIAKALPSAAEGGALAGASSDETLALLSVLAARFKSGDTAADRIKALATRIGLDQGGEGRESLAGKGIIKAVEQLLTLTEEQQREFLGSSQEVNGAFQVLREEITQIKQRQEVIRQARESTGTAQSPTALRVQEARSDEKLRAELNARIAALKKEVAQENRRAVEEGNRQAAADLALAKAAESGVSKRGIAAAEVAQEGLGALTGVEFGGELVSAISEVPLDNLFRDVSFSSQRGNEDASAAALLVNRIQKLRKTDPNAVASRDAVAEFVRGTTGEYLSPGDVTIEQRNALTAAVFAQAEQSRGFDRTASISLLGAADRFTGGNVGSIPFLGTAGRSANEEGVNASIGIQQRFAAALAGNNFTGSIGTANADAASQKMLDALERNNRLLEESNELARQRTDDTRRMADGDTNSEPPDYGDIQRDRLQ
ncbi:phage tail tape measure protein [Roseiconus lacunae]|uniref:phage tail tape measure protein n=1 Tax=Roseiconus lacunae TaxID=2605694 RepID=UPI00308F2B08|nr:phage tail tape measure protein [Stieleria sp. HD01]